MTTPKNPKDEMTRLVKAGDAFAVVLSNWSPGARYTLCEVMGFDEEWIRLKPYALEGVHCRSDATSFEYAPEDSPEREPFWLNYCRHGKLTIRHI